MIRATVYNLAVQAVEVGKPNDGVTQPLFSSGTEIDKSWSQLSQEFTDARAAWRLNPMARRVIGTITGYVVGDGMSASSEYEPLNEFIGEFWNHPRNGIPRRLREWSKELARAGELFITLHPNTDSGLCQVRAVPASRIPRVVWRKGDHEMELAYKEIVPRTAGDLDTLSNLDGRWWLSPDGWRMLYEGMSDVQDGAVDAGAQGARQGRRALDATLCGQSAGGRGARRGRFSADPDVAAALPALARGQSSPQWRGAHVFMAGPGSETHPRCSAQKVRKQATAGRRHHHSRRQKMRLGPRSRRICGRGTRRRTGKRFSA